MYHFNLASRSLLITASLFAAAASAHAFQMAPGERAKTTENSINTCVNKHLASGQFDASWTSRIRSYCACSTENLLNEMTESEARQFTRTRVAPASLQAKAERASEMCEAQLNR